LVAQPTTTPAAAIEDRYKNSRRDNERSNRSIFVTSSLLIDRLPAVGAVIESLIELPAALPTHPGWHTGLGRRCRPPVICHASLAATAEQKGLTLFYPEQWDEKQADVMVHLPDLRLMQTALLAAPRRRIHGPGSGLNAGDKKTHRLNPWDWFFACTYTTEPDDSVNNVADEKWPLRTPLVMHARRSGKLGRSFKFNVLSNRWYRFYNLSGCRGNALHLH
jgi:hypothetical protein